MIVNAGLDFAAAQLGGAGGTATATYICLSASGTAVVATDTSVPGEITTAGGGLIRAKATYAHTTGASNYTLTNQFTANGSDALPVTIAKAGVLTASSAGTLVFEDLLSTTATLSASGDSLTITETVTT